MRQGKEVAKAEKTEREREEKKGEFLLDER
jgi:hypothetical protein